MLAVLSTFPDEATANGICAALVTEGLAACANIVPRVTSIYRWEGELKQEGETLAIIKIPVDGFDGLESRLTELHPYDVPEIVAIRPEAVNAGYLSWIAGK